MPTVSVYTRHSLDCPKSEDPHWKRCRCPKWHYCPEWSPTRRTAKTRSWEEAERRARALESPGTQKDSILGKTVTDAVRMYREDKNQQGLSGNWEAKIRREMGEFEAWCRMKPLVYLKEVTLAHLEDYRKTWAGAPITRKKRQERLRGFFTYCIKHGWVERNPAAFLSVIKPGVVQVQPFTKNEWERILKATETYDAQSAWRRERARAMVLYLRHSGLRLGDAARSERSRLDGDRLFLYTQKTGTPVTLPLPQEVVQALTELKNPENPKYFFWNGQTDLKTPVYRWWETLKLIFKEAKIEGRAHPHRFRHSFAVGLLLSGVPLEQVSILLGHRSIKVTEKYYSAWVKARQEQLEASVRKSWTQG